MRTRSECARSNRSATDSDSVSDSVSVPDSDPLRPSALSPPRAIHSVTCTTLHGTHPPPV
eukprot:4124347-Pyramimonas_sp.AAC.1